MQAPTEYMDMITLGSEAVSNGMLGVMIGTIISFLRNRQFLTGANDSTTKFLTLSFSYVLAFATSLGIHWTVNGDLWTGDGSTIQLPNLQHMLEGAVLTSSNIVGQKGWAVGMKTMNAVHGLFVILQKYEPLLEKSLAAAQADGGEEHPDPKEEMRLRLEAQKAELEKKLADLLKEG